MKLNFEQLKSISFGAYSITDENGVYTYKKCSPHQVEIIKKYREDLVRNAENSTGCCLDFHTDSDFFAFIPVAGDKYDLYINDVFSHHFILNDNREKILVELPEGENRVTLIFPSHNGFGKISDVELSDNAKFVPHNYKLKMAFFGDSITQGWDSGYDSLSYAWNTARYFDAEVWNCGVGGNVFLSDFADKREDFEPDVVIVAYGTNDFAVSPSLDFIETQADGFLSKMSELYKNSKIFVLLPIWRGDLKGWENPIGTFEDVRMKIKEVAENKGLNVIDAFGFVPPMEEFFADKVLHPNAMGFGIYAQNLIKVLSDKI